MQTAVLYVRTSATHSSDETESSTDEWQEQRLSAYCAEHGIAVQCVFHDDTDGHTNPLRALFETLQHADGIVALSPDRISRDPETLYRFAAFLIAMDKELAYVIS